LKEEIVEYESNNKTLKNDIIKQKLQIGILKQTISYKTSALKRKRGDKHSNEEMLNEVQLKISEFESSLIKKANKVC